MEREFVPYELAVKLKSLGFDEECFGFYNPTVTEKVIMNNDSYGGYGLSYEHIVGAPTFSQAFRWFRDKGYDVSFRKYDYGDESVFTGYYYTIYIGNETIDLHGADKRSKTYEGCELACLDKLIEIVESKSE